jgi:FAD/FMN-containing dehydrogenase
VRRKSMRQIGRREFLQTGAAGAAGLYVGGGFGARALAEAVPGSGHAAALRELARKLHGRLLLPGDPGYLAASRPANGRYRSIYPLAVAKCADEHDVVTCVNWSRRHGIPPVARGGGHSYAGFSTTHGLLVNIDSLNSVVVDHKRGTAVVGGAALNNDMFNATVNGPLFLPAGTCLGVGLGGLVLGGGIGYNTHWAGLTSDHLGASRIVTASGDILHLDESHHHDLFWACRGGAGGSFGINTSFTFHLVKVPKKVAYYRFEWQGADAAAAVLATFDKLMTSAPAALNAVAMAQATPVGKGGAREAIIVFSRGQFIGPLSELKHLVQPLLKAAPSPTKVILQEMTFWDMQKVFATTEPEPHSFGDISRYAAKPVPEHAVDKMVDLLTHCPSRTDAANGSVWSLGWVGGSVVNSIGRRDSAYVHRGMTTLLRPTPVWPNDAPHSVGAGLKAWTDDVVKVIDPYTPNESYQNFPNRRIHDWKQAYYAENFDRLVRVKTKYDPRNLFHNPQSIPTSRQGGRG